MLKEVRYIQLHKKSRVQLFKEGTSGRTALLTQHFLLQIHTLIKYDFPPVFFSYIGVLADYVHSPLKRHCM